MQQRWSFLLSNDFVFLRQQQRLQRVLDRSPAVHIQAVQHLQQKVGCKMRTKFAAQVKSSCLEVSLGATKRALAKRPKTLNKPLITKLYQPIDLGATHTSFSACGKLTRTFLLRNFFFSHFERK